MISKRPLIYRIIGLLVLIHIYCLSYSQASPKVGWIDDESVWEMQQNESVNLSEQLDSLICVSKDFQYCLMLRYHKSWTVDNAIYDMNTPPDKEESGRWVLNIYWFDKKTETKGWSKTFVPLKYKSVNLDIDENRYVIKVDNLIYSEKFKYLDKLMFDFPVEYNNENEIESQFERFSRK